MSVCLHWFLFLNGNELPDQYHYYAWSFTFDQNYQKRIGNASFYPKACQNRH